MIGQQMSAPGYKVWERHLFERESKFSKAYAVKYEVCARTWAALAANTLFFAAWWCNLCAPAMKA